MYKTIPVAVLLLAIFAFTSGSKSVGALPTGQTSPVIVARGALRNQTATIPTTTVFTPKDDGLYQLTVYADITQSNPASQSYWNFTPAWADDTGVQTDNGVLWGNGASYGPFYSSNSYLGGTMIPFEAKAGMPITYTVTQTGPPDGSVYALYYTLERLE
jgi:hypothetical protein